MTAKQIRQDLEEILAYQNSPDHERLSAKIVLERVLNLTRVVEALEARISAIEREI